MADEKSDQTQPKGVGEPAGKAAYGRTDTGPQSDGRRAGADQRPLPQNDRPWGGHPYVRVGGYVDQFTQPDAPLTPHQFYTRVKFIESKLPRILISPDAYKRMQLYVELARLEVGWLGTAERLESGDYYIEHVFLIRQNAGAAHARISVEGQMELYTDLIKAGRREDTRRLLFWGHSHVRMDTQPSPQDDATMLELKEQRNKWFIRGILNKLGRASFDLYMFDQNMYFVDLPWEIWSPAPIVEEQEPKSGLAAMTEGLSGLKDKVVKGTKRLLETFSTDPVSKPQKETQGPLTISAALRAEVEAEIRDKVTVTYMPSFGGGMFGEPDLSGALRPIPGGNTGDGGKDGAGNGKEVAGPGKEGAGTQSVNRASATHIPGPPEALPSTTGGGARQDLQPSEKAPGASGE